MRLIDADALMKLLVRVHLTYENGVECLGYTTVCFGSVIQNEPTIDAEPVRHGHWIEAHDNDGLDYECSNRKCQCRISYNGAKVSGDFNYCPNCGAKMDEVIG